MSCFSCEKDLGEALAWRRLEVERFRASHAHEPERMARLLEKAAEMARQIVEEAGGRMQITQAAAELMKPSSVVAVPIRQAYGKFKKFAASLPGFVVNGDFVELQDRDKAKGGRKRAAEEEQPSRALPSRPPEVEVGFPANARFSSLVDLLNSACEVLELRARVQECAREGSIIKVSFTANPDFAEICDPHLRFQVGDAALSVASRDGAAAEARMRKRRMLVDKVAIVLEGTDCKENDARALAGRFGRLKSFWFGKVTVVEYEDEATSKAAAEALCGVTVGVVPVFAYRYAAVLSHPLPPPSPLQPVAPVAASGAASTADRSYDSSDFIPFDEAIL